MSTERRYPQVGDWAQHKSGLDPRQVISVSEGSDGKVRVKLGTLGASLWFDAVDYDFVAPAENRPAAPEEKRPPMSRDEFVRAMGGQDKIDAAGARVIECACDHECCPGWNTEPTA